MFKCVAVKTKFRQKTVEERDTFIRVRDGLAIRNAPSLATLNCFSEHVIGAFSLGQSIVLDACINSKLRQLPLVTEEPSVVAAINKGISIFNSCKGVIASNDTNHVLMGQVHVSLDSLTYKQMCDYIKANQEKIKSMCAACIPKLARLIDRGGGFSGDFDLTQQGSTNYCCLEFSLDVQESMGANIVNTVAETIATELKNTFSNSLRVLFSILSNDCSQRKSYAEVAIVLDDSKTIPLSTGILIEEASYIAYLNKQRAVTHNKGIMNGVIALALATGQDTRAVESAAHFYAQDLGNNNQYGPLSTWKVNNGVLYGKLAIPTPTSVVGRLKDNHAHVNDNLVQLMQNPNAFELGQCMACVGLASNFSALLALVTDGISKGHMSLHNCGVFLESRL